MTDPLLGDLNAAPRWALHVDLSGSTAAPEGFRSVEVRGDWDWPPERIRAEAARFYGVPLDHVTDPWPTR